MSESFFLPVGLTGSGKSTFVAALSYVVEQADIEGALKLVALDGDAAYVHGLRKSWLSFEPLERTSGPAELTRMRLVDALGREVSLVIPDLPGEEYDAQWEHRGWSSHSDELARASTGLLLFVHPRSAGTPELISAVMAGVDVDDEPEDIGEWMPKSAPAQTKLVDVLQFLEPVLPPPRPIRVAFVVSAWDLVAQSATSYTEVCPTPKEFVWQSAGFAQLAQYLAAHPERYHLRTYGMSAQGGRLSEGEDRERLTRLMPEDRISVQWHEGDVARKSRDITEPIKWLMGP